MKFRFITLVAVSAMALSACSSSGGSGGTPDAIRMVETGGASGESIKVAYGNPFTEATGVKLVQETPPDMGKLEAMVKSGNVTADLYELGGSAVQLAVDSDLIQKLDWEAIDPEPMNEAAKTPYGLGYQTFALYMGSLKDTKPITTWQEFWDTSAVPGKRAIPAYARYALPIALLADGVKPQDLYPIDIDRAVKSLEKIADDLILWDAASQTPQLLESKEAVYVATWDNVYPKDGFYTSFDNAVRDQSFIVIPKGAKNVEYANKLLHEMSKVENQVKAAGIIPLAGPSPELLDHLSADVIESMPANPSNEATQATYDYAWWAENGDAVNERWEQFKLESLG